MKTDSFDPKDLDIPNEKPYLNSLKKATKFLNTSKSELSTMALLIIMTIILSMFMLNFFNNSLNQAGPRLYEKNIEFKKIEPRQERAINQEEPAALSIDPKTIDTDQKRYIALAALFCKGISSAMTSPPVSNSTTLLENTHDTYKEAINNGMSSALNTYANNLIKSLPPATNREKQ